MSSVDRVASAEKAEGEGGRPEGTGTGFERKTRVKWETRSERGGFYETDGLEMDRPSERYEGRHEKKKKEG